MWARAAVDTKGSISKRWTKAYRTIAAAGNRWLRVRGPITATIATLLDRGFKPLSPTQWLTPDGQYISNFDHEPGISQYHVLDQIQRMLELKQWEAASSHHNGSGLASGLPCLAPTSRAYNDLIKKGKLEEAAALEAVVVNKVWTKERMLAAGIIDQEEAKCDRCGEAFDSDFHR